MSIAKESSQLIKYVMEIDVVTLFPKMFEGFVEAGVLGRAKKKGLVKINVHDMRKWAWNDYKAVDDRPFGGGVGMVIRPDVIGEVLKDLKGKSKQVIALSAKGKRFGQGKAEELSKVKKILLICGRYEGFDQRILDNMVNEVVSIGDYVLSGGETAAMVVIEAVTRLLPGVLGKDESNQEDSFTKTEEGRKIEYGQYTRPENYKGLKVPEILRGGDHEKIRQWRNGRRSDQSGRDEDDGEKSK